MKTALVRNNVTRHREAERERCSASLIIAQLNISCVGGREDAYCVGWVRVCGWEDEGMGWEDEYGGGRMRVCGWEGLGMKTMCVSVVQLGCEKEEIVSGQRPRRRGQCGRL